MNLVGAIKFLTEKRGIKVLVISLIGAMGEGKTSFMRYLSLNLDNYKQFYASGIHISEVPKLLEELRGCGTKIALFLDDISFVISGTAKEVKEAENAVSRIRHILENMEGTTILCLAYHYNRAVNPFLRGISKVVVLFSITRTELDMYEDIFTRRYLREFLIYYDAWIWLNPKLVKKMKSKGMDPFTWRPVLARVVDKEHITWVPYVKESKWEVISQISKESESKSKEVSKHIHYLLERLRKLREKGVIKLTGKYIYIKTNGKEVPFMKREIAEELGIV